MDRFYNIEEQKHWNDPDAWINEGHEWSGPFGTTEKLWNDHIFDSVKHANVIEEYIKEISRVLVLGGYGFIHHSWFTGGEDMSFKNIAGRSNMSPDLFAQMVESNGMKIISQSGIEFFKTTDIISIFKKI